jgi:hypothetical protein
LIALKIERANLYSICFQDSKSAILDFNLDSKWIKNVINPFMGDIDSQLSAFPALKPTMPLLIKSHGVEVRHQIWPRELYEIYDCYPGCKEAFRRITFDEWIFLTAAAFNECKIVFISDS